MDNRRKRIIIIGAGPIGQCMGAPAIRSLEIATSLSRNFEVFLVIPNKPTITPLDFHLVWNKDPALKKLLEGSDGVMIMGIVEKCPLWLFLSKKPILVDLYIPYSFELLEMKKTGISFIRFLWETRLILLLKRGDFFICASEKQRHLWLGAMAILGRIVAEIYQRNKLGRGLIDVVPFGIPEISPEKEKEVFKGQVISSTDKLVLWNGGIWRWLDPLTLIKAI